MKYEIEFITGTHKWVIDELKFKHPTTRIISELGGQLAFESDEELNSFANIFSALRITRDGDKNSLNLYRREWRKEFVPAGINPALAYVMCEVAEIKATDVVLDPFCGGGTIPVTVAAYFKPKQIIASDLSGKAIDITQRNITRAKVKNIMVFRSDVSMLKLGAGSISKIITNLPFGIREKSHDQNIKIYENFAAISKKALSATGKIVLLTQEIKLIEQIFNDKGFKKVADYPVDQGGLRPHIFVFELVPISH